MNDDMPMLNAEEVVAALPQILEQAGNGSAVMMHDSDGRAMVTFYKPGRAQAVADDQEQVLVFVLSVRPGAMRFFHELEHTFFPPRTPLNLKLAMLYVYWQDMMWIGVRVPADMRDCLDLTALRTDMKIADGVPTMIGPDGMDHFPLNAPNVFTLENKRGSKVYDGVEAAEEMRRAEIAEIDKEYEK